MKQDKFIAETAIIDSEVSIGDGCAVWHFSHLRSRVILGLNVVVGEGVYIDEGVEIGENSKIQNGAQIFAPSKIGKGVFIGPRVILTNDKFPRAINFDGSIKKKNDWNAVGTIVEDFASIGAGAICVSPILIGEGSMVAAGAVVTRNVPAYTLVAGCPARVIRKLA